MRHIYITIDGETLIPSDTFVGRAGEHKATTLTITLPEAWKAKGMTYYLGFNRSIDTLNGGVLTEPLPVEDGAVSFALPQAVMVQGRLRVQLQARDEELVVLTAMCDLMIAQSILPAKQVEDAYAGLLDEIVERFDALEKEIAEVEKKIQTDVPKNIKDGIGVGSVVYGVDTVAEAYGTSAGGVRTYAYGYASDARGERTQASARAQSVVGQYNALDSDALFIVGNGTDTAHRSNAFTVRKDGTLLTNGQPFGDEFMRKPSVTSEMIVTIKPNGTTDRLAFRTDAAALSIPRRDGAGCLATATPTADGHAVNKKYVDDALTEEWVDICDLTTTEDSVIDITADASGNPFSLKKMNVLVWKPVVEGDTTPSMVWTHALTGSTAAYKPLTSSPTAMAGNQATFHAVCAEIKRFWFAESRCGNGVNANANVFMVNSGWLPYGVRPEMKNRDPITGIRLTWGYSGTLPAGTRVEIWGVRA